MAIAEILLFTMAYDSPISISHHGDLVERAVWGESGASIFVNGLCVNSAPIVAIPLDKYKTKRFSKLQGKIAECF